MVNFKNCDLRLKKKRERKKLWQVDVYIPLLDVPFYKTLKRT